MPRRLTAKERRELPAKAFGIPSQRKYPVMVIGRDGKSKYSRSHAIDAKARAKEGLEQGWITKRQYNAIMKKADAAEKATRPKKSRTRRKANPSHDRGVSDAVVMATVEEWNENIRHEINQEHTRKNREAGWPPPFFESAKDIWRLTTPEGYEAHYEEFAEYYPGWKCGDFKLMLRNLDFKSAGLENYSPWRRLMGNPKRKRSARRKKNPMRKTGMEDWSDQELLAYLPEIRQKWFDALDNVKFGRESNIENIFDIYARVIDEVLARSVDDPDIAGNLTTAEVRGSMSGLDAAVREWRSKAKVNPKKRRGKIKWKKTGLGYRSQEFDMGSGYTAILSADKRPGGKYILVASIGKGAAGEPDYAYWNTEGYSLQKVKADAEKMWAAGIYSPIKAKRGQFPFSGVPSDYFDHNDRFVDPAKGKPKAKPKKRKSKRRKNPARNGEDAWEIYFVGQAEKMNNQTLLRARVALAELLGQSKNLEIDYGKDHANMALRMLEIYDEEIDRRELHTNPGRRKNPTAADHRRVRKDFEVIRDESLSAYEAGGEDYDLLRAYWASEGFDQENRHLEGLDTYQGISEITRELEARVLSRMKNPGRKRRKKNPMHEGDEEYLANKTDLRLTIENDGDLYRDHRRPLEWSLARKMKDGSYDHDRAVGFWFGFVNNGADKYGKEQGLQGFQIKKKYPSSMRKEIAEEMATDWEEEYAVQNNPKKRRRKNAGYMNKSQFEKYFRKEYMPNIRDMEKLWGRKDPSFRSQTWNEAIDRAEKAGMVDLAKSYSWSQPSWLGGVKNPGRKGMPKNPGAKQKMTRRKTARRLAKPNPSAAEHEKAGMDALKKSESYWGRYDDKGRINDLLDCYKFLVIAHEELKYSGKKEPRIQARDGLKDVRREILSVMK
jgi:hypothetical protein